MPGADKCPPVTRFPRPKDPPRKPEHSKHPTKPKAPESKHFRDPEGPACFVPGIENPTFGPYEPKVEDLIWKDEELVDIDTAFPNAESRTRAEREPWTVRGLCVWPKGVTGPVPFVLMMHQAGGHYAGYRELQELLASHGVASVSASDNDSGVVDWSFAELYFEDEARRAKLCVRLAERFANFRGLSFGPRIGLLGHSRGGWAAQNLATLINRGSDSLTGLADDPDSFSGCRVEGVCLVGTSSHHASAPTCPILLIHGGRDEDLFVDPSWWLAGRPAAGFISVAYVPGANHNWFNSETVRSDRTGGRIGPNSPTIRAGLEHVRILIGLASALFLQRLLGRFTALLNGTAVLPDNSWESNYRIAYRASDSVSLIKDFGMSYEERGREVSFAFLVPGGTQSGDVDVQGAVFNPLAADTQAWPDDVSVYTPPWDVRSALICCGHGLVVRRVDRGHDVPPNVPAGIRLPLPAQVVLSDWMIAVTASAVDPNPSYTPDGTRLPPSFVGGGFFVGVEPPRLGVERPRVAWSNLRRLAANDDLQQESSGGPGLPFNPSGFQRRCCDPNPFRLNHIPYVCRSPTPDLRNNGTTAYATTYWFSAACFVPSKQFELYEVAAVWINPSPEAALAIQRVDLIRRRRLLRE